LTSARKGLILAELEDLLTGYDKFEPEDAKLSIEEFTSIFDFAYSFTPENNLLMTQNFVFVKAINQLIKYVNS